MRSEVASAGQLGHREVVRPLEEDPLAVHGALPVVPGDLAQPRASTSSVTHLAVDEHFHVDVDEWLVTEGPWPPQRRVGDVDVPLDLVLAGRDDELLLAVDLTADRRTDRHRRFAVAVEPSGDAQVGPSFVGVTAQHPEAVDPHRARVVTLDRPPQPAGVGRRCR